MSNKTFYATPLFSNKTNCNANCNFNIKRQHFDTIASLTYDPQKKVYISLTFEQWAWKRETKLDSYMWSRRHKCTMIYHCLFVDLHFPVFE